MTRQELPPLELINSEILEFSYKTNTKYRGESKRGEVLTTVTSSIAVDDPLVHKVELEIKTAGRMHPYAFKLMISGIFKVSEDIEGEESRKLIVARNGSSMLYSAAREYIFMTTCHGRHRSVVLPTVSFLGLQPQPEQAD